MLLFQRSSKWITHFVVIVVVTYIALYLFKAHTVTNCNQLSFHNYININYDSFRIDNTDHIFDVNKKQNDHDQVDLVCPQTAQVQQDLHRSNLTTQQQQQQQSSNDSAQQNERYIIYNVSKDEYDTCRLTGNPRVVALCDQTSGRQRPPFTVTFRPFTPQPNGLEFQAGQDYYFISALPGNPNDPKRFSPCRDLNMRVIFKVCCKSSSAAAAASLPAAASTTASGGSAQVSRPGGSLSAALLPPTHRPPASSSSSRRPSVMTIRPSLLNHHHQQTQPQPQRQPPDAAADLFLRTSAPALAGAPFAPQVPVTVLPIEVLQPSSSEQPTQSSAIKSAAGSGADQDNSEQNNILQDQQQPSSPTPRPSLAAFPHLMPGSSFGQQQQQQQFFGHHHHQQQQQQPARPPLTLFDPNLTPDKYRHRYPPTPLPEQLLTNPQRRPETAPQRVPQVSRGQLYQQSYLQPWNSQFEPTRNTRVADRDLWKEPTSGASRLVEAHQHLLLLLPLLGALCLQHLFTNFLLTPTNHPHLHRYRYR